MPYSHILVPSDGSDLSKRAIAHALQLASRLGARVTFVHVHATVPLPRGGLGEAQEPRTREALSAAHSRLAAKEESLTRRSAELDWRDGALRDLESQLAAREAGWLPR